MDLNPDDGRKENAAQVSIALTMRTHKPSAVHAPRSPPFSTTDAVAYDGLFALALGRGKLRESGVLRIVKIAKKVTSGL